MKKLIKSHYQAIQEFINTIRVGIFIADGKGNVLMVNDESERTGGLSRGELIGRNMTDLMEEGYVTDSTIIRAIRSRKEEHLIQDLGSGEKQYISGVPLLKNGKIDLIVCTERDVTETANLKSLLQEKEKIAEKFESELEYLRSRQLNAGRDIVLESYEMRQAVELAIRVAQLDTTVLISGESGTGKELIASLIHKSSNRAEQAFIKINCAAIPENLLESELFGYEKGAFTGADKNGKAGMFELADRGTLFLDEIGEMNPQMQSKLLRVLQEREVRRIGGGRTVSVNVRIIAATNINLQQAIEEGGFREDLYYRLNVVPIEMPPLRERREDIRGLACHFVNMFNKEYNLDKVLMEDAIRVLEQYDWPGNVRELRNIIERIMISFDGREITRFQVNHQIVREDEDRHRAYPAAQAGTLAEQVERFEKDLLARMLREYRSGSRVASLLGVNKSTISRKMARYDLDYEELTDE